MPSDQDLRPQIEDADFSQIFADESLYRELMRTAQRQLRREYSSDGALLLEPEALVNEAYLRLHSGTQSMQYASREHFMAVCASAMRHILVDYARRNYATKRGNGNTENFSNFELDRLSYSSTSADVLAIDEALNILKAVDPLKATIVELRFFAGMTLSEVAGVVGLGLTATKEHYRLAKAYLRRTLEKKS